MEENAKSKDDDKTKKKEKNVVRGYFCAKRKKDFVHSFFSSFLFELERLFLVVWMKILKPRQNLSNFTPFTKQPKNYFLFPIFYHPLFLFVIPYYTHKQFL